MLNFKLNENVQSRFLSGKKIILVIALFGFAIAQTNAQSPAAVSTKKTSPTG